jgi:hypothetical protein
MNIIMKWFQLYFLYLQFPQWNLRQNQFNEWKK